ncbi:putative Fe-S cluster protein YjdI [Aliiruegeria haliotis]|uniref:Putative Fe-S cluster protein YjdI n=1 Tax=Aliiruegeria haliotis TaxID=1280846 RepID=A0A2T0RPB4_9RHOB|nr:CDGSH iron-sulfur domain-containing protein [Aliiruegeria haliotis]PRY23039.1 putative Fe-S cluster protein YjdI [Aliiruegeria haliotis]
MSDTRASIEERENGPLVVKGVTSIERTDGQPVEARPAMALCRCGASGNKPFCDGSHAKVGFESRGGKPAGRDRLLSYEGEAVTVHFNPLLCAHAAECGRIASHIFNDQQRPWIQPDKGSVDEVLAVVRSCPSGALTVTGKDGAPQHILSERTQITVQKDGPYWVQDVAPPVPTQAAGATPRKYVLCRCGKSGNKPFCDGTHRDAGWSDGAPEA